MCRRILVAPLFALPLMFVSARVEAVVHNETTNGDLSNSGSSPTQLTLSAGTNSIIASMPSSDLDFVTVHIPANHQFTALTLASYTSVDGTSFIGMKNGTTIAITSNPANLDGYTHFGTARGNVGTDILDDIGSSFGSTGFTPPLPSGSYSFWIQQASSANVSYQFDFTVAALPPTELEGDYNGNQVVDAADYTVWRKTFGATGADQPADGDGSLAVDNLDYDLWVKRFNNTSGSGGAPVPEPTFGWLLCGGLLLTAFVRPLAACRHKRLSRGL